MKLTIILPLHASALYNPEFLRKEVIGDPSLGVTTVLEVDEFTKE